MKHSVPATREAAGQELPRELTADLQSLMHRMQEASTPYALATVVRTISVTAAKAGAKAVINAEGAIVGGWIGGGCARSAVIKAAKAALEDGDPRLISIQPEELLAELGVEAGDQREGVHFAKNMCPSQGTMDIFVEPVLPRPVIVICGASPVAAALAAQAPSISFSVTVCAPPGDQAIFANADNWLDRYDLSSLGNGDHYVIVSTQGRGDLVALEAAVAARARHIGFVGSRKKLASLREKLRERGFQDNETKRIKGPAGLDLGAITPEEIALSILSELVMIRRKDQRQSNIFHV